MKTLHEIEENVVMLAARICAAASVLPTCGRTEDGARPHIEAGAGTYRYVIVERGCELERRTTSDIDELLYWVFADVTHAMAFEYELHHRVHDRDCRRIAFPRQIELMSKLGTEFGRRMACEIERILRRAPYDDGPFRASVRSAGMPGAAP